MKAFVMIMLLVGFPVVIVALYIWDRQKFYKNRILKLKPIRYWPMEEKSEEFKRHKTVKR